VSISQEFDPASVPIRPAATVMLVRDTIGSLEVFMMRRTTKAAFAGGMYVFPGGAVDETDGSRGDSTRRDSSYEMASIRECFEEAGVLLACDRDGCTVRFDSPDVQSRFAAYRHTVHAGERSMTSVLDAEGLTPRLDDLAWVAHWITPFGEVRRFDTRFFVAAMPEDQDPLHDDIETVDSLWVRPSDALERAASGELLMLPPTVANLRFLADHRNVDDVMDAARRVGTPPRILPKVVWGDDGRIVNLLMPGDDGYDAVPER
jgi:8-oxo-dGTP pyrophosphatase MutT (NUDIX family)